MNAFAATSDLTIAAAPDGSTQNMTGEGTAVQDFVYEFRSSLHNSPKHWEY
jgi:hypothetical protein